MHLDRRSLLKLSAATLAAGGLALPTHGQAIDELVIAYSGNLPSWDPTVGPSAVNPTIQGIYQSVFDQYILQHPDLKPAPGLLTDWGWSEDKKQVWMSVREGVSWHDGSPFTAEDEAWNLALVAKPESGSPIQFVWGTLTNHRVEDNKVIADVAQFDPTIFKCPGPAAAAHRCKLCADPARPADGSEPLAPGRCADYRPPGRYPGLVKGHRAAA